MCGISAAVHFGDGTGVVERVLRMHAAIPQRGPDGEGFLFVEPSLAAVEQRSAAHAASVAGAHRAGLGFRWLQVQDREPLAAQPMGSVDRSIWIAFNGEIYNHSELRAALRDLGHDFRTRSDTEVALLAYREWGTGCFARFNGMWAIVILDASKRRLVISRDRFGIKPLFHCFDGDVLLLASEVKQILAASAPPPAPNLDALRLFLQGSRSQLGDDTFFAGIHAVPAATFSEVDLDAPARALGFRAYWRLSDFTCPDPAPALSFPDAALALASLLRSAIADQATAEVPVGSLLSGGLDSSLITSLLALVEGGRPSFSFASDPRQNPLDESKHVEAVVAQRGLTNHRTSFDVSWVRENLPAVTRAQEEPLAGMALLAQYRTYQLAAEHGVRAVLDGQGADEVFGGYRRYHDLLLRDRLVKGRLLDFGREAVALSHADPHALDGLARRALIQPLRRRLTGPAIHAWLREAPRRARRPSTNSGSDRAAVNRALQADVRGNLGALLAISDRNSMAHSVEARFPYLDHRIVELAFGLPDSYKVGKGVRKRLLREVARGVLPASVVARTDRLGFATPEREWISGPLRQDLVKGACEAASRVPELLDAEEVSRFVDGFYAGHHDDFRAVWRLFALRHWAAAFSL
jgi:asparagine synthase (glutamine-hydrolysing)